MSVRGALGGISFLWRSRWNLLRLALAVFVVWVLAADTSARLARRAMSMMPDFDYAAEVRALRLEGRYGEAMVIAESGLTDMEGPAREELVAERDLTREEQDSFLRRAKDVGLGALSGTGDSLEGLVGAVGADLFIVGDVRDLAIQGTKQVLDGDSDEVILVLSIAGIVTTLAPEVDWVPSILKVARRAGAMSERFADFLVTAIKRQDVDRLKPVFEDVRAIAGKASPGGAARLLKHADDPEDLAKIARFVERHPGGAAALHIAGKEGADAIKAAAGRGPEAALAAEKMLVQGARKGTRGVRFLTQGPGRVLLRPHPLLGIVKALYKGNAAEVLTKLSDRLDPGAWWMLPAGAGWALFECGLLVLRFRGMRRGGAAAAGAGGSSTR
ncbi:hypothetical protein PHYC_00313 [Phycisphaerales bacterium]|nr:hypothetical protein PHYC_00313 [Phycisphaerales bacterium]